MTAIAPQPSPILELTNLSAGQWIQFVHAYAHGAMPHLPDPFKVLSLYSSSQWINQGRAQMLDSSGKTYDYIPRNHQLGDAETSPFGLDALWCCKAKVLTQEEAKEMLGTTSFEILEKMAAELSPVEKKK